MNWRTSHGKNSNDLTLDLIVLIYGDRGEAKQELGEGMPPHTRRHGEETPMEALEGGNPRSPNGK